MRMALQMKVARKEAQLPLYLAPLDNPITFNPPEQRRCILVVDDHPVNLFFARHMLAKCGFDAVHTAQNGSRALNMISQNKYELAIIDCQMPGMDGYALARSIRDLENGSSRRTPLIAMTAHAAMGNRQKCFDAGMDDYVTKSIGGGYMMEALMKWLNVEAVHAENMPHIPMAFRNTDLPVDLSLLEECVGDDAEAKQMAIDLFVEGAHECMVDLSVARTTNDELRWKQAAHKFKGAAANFGAEHLRQCCMNAEHNALSGMTDKEIMFTAIDQALVAVKRYLNIGN